MAINVKDQELIISIKDTFYYTPEGIATIQNTLIHSLKVFTEKDKDLNTEDKFTMFELVMLLSNMPISGRGSKGWSDVISDLSELCVQDNDLVAQDKFRIYRLCESMAKLVKDALETPYPLALSA